MTSSNKDSKIPALSRHDWFYVGGQYSQSGDETYMSGQLYVEHFVPEALQHNTPVVMIHGGVQTGSNFISTAQGQRGWLGDFLAAGYAVYIVDQPERGRSGHRLTDASTDTMLRYSAEGIERRFTAPADTPRWPQARHHTEWPGSGRRGDPLFDRFFASQVEMLADRDAIEQLNVDAGIALLDAIGDAIVLTHSQSGPFGWLIADARPQHVKGIVAIEPNGPPFRDVEFKGDPDWFGYQNDVSRPYGITRLPITFEPPVDDPTELAPVVNDDTETNPGHSPSGDALVQGLLPTGPRRRLPALEGIPILIVSAEASYHAAYDQCTSAFLNWAGVDHDFVRLESVGIRGNGHMVMLEKNSHLVADFLVRWLNEKVG